MEAKSQQNFYKTGAIVVISSKLSLWSIHFQDLVQKATKLLIIMAYAKTWSGVEPWSGVMEWCGFLEWFFGVVFWSHL